MTRRGCLYAGCGAIFAGLFALVIVVLALTGLGEIGIQVPIQIAEEGKAAVQQLLVSSTPSSTPTFTACQLGDGGTCTPTPGPSSTPTATLTLTATMTPTNTPEPWVGICYSYHYLLEGNSVKRAINPRTGQSDRIVDGVINTEKSVPDSRGLVQCWWSEIIDMWEADFLAGTPFLKQFDGEEDPGLLSPTPAPTATPTRSR